MSAVLPLHGARVISAFLLSRFGRCEAVDAIAREHLADVKRKLADLSTLRRELESLIGHCRHGTVAECRILEALAPAAVNMKRA
jgi:hypothetical protein